MPSPSLLLFTDASLTGWGTHLDLTAAGVWSREKKGLHINILERKAVVLALNAFLDTLAEELGVLMSNNITVVAHLKKQDGTASKALCDLAQEIILWTEVYSIILSARYIPGKIMLVDQLSRRTMSFP